MGNREIGCLQVFLQGRLSVTGSDSGLEIALESKVFLNESASVGKRLTDVLVSSRS